MRIEQTRSCLDVLIVLEMNKLGRLHACIHTHTHTLFENIHHTQFKWCSITIWMCHYALTEYPERNQSLLHTPIPPPPPNTHTHMHACSHTHIFTMCFVCCCFPGMWAASTCCIYSCVVTSWRSAAWPMTSGCYRLAGWPCMPSLGTTAGAPWGRTTLCQSSTCQREWRGGWGWATCMTGPWRLTEMPWVWRHPSARYSSSR